MSSIATAVVGSAVLGYVAADNAADSADAQTAAGERNAVTAAQVSRDQLDFAKEQWTSYQTNILPMEMEAQQLGISGQELALQRGQDDYQMYTDWYKPMAEQMNQLAIDGVKPRYMQVTRDAAANVDTQFSREEDMQKRDMQRAGIDPRSGRAQAGSNDMSARRATSRALAMNTATENETNRVEDLGFNRLAVATGRTPLGSQPSQNAGSPRMDSSGVTSAYSNVGNTYQNASNQNYSNAANYGNTAAGSMQAGISTAANLYSMSRNNGNSGVQQPNMFVPGNNSFNYDQVNNFQGNMTPEAFGPQYKDGGMVGVTRPRYANGGVVNGAPGVDQVPATIDGQQPARISSGEYVIPADVVSIKGVEFFDKLLDRYHAGPAPAHKQNMNGIRRH